MRQTLLVALTLIALAAPVPAQDQPAATRQRLTYPASRKVDQIDTYGAVKVADPYRWLEDINSSEVAKWVEAQNQLTFSYLATIPQRDRIRQRLTELWNYERFGTPHKQAGLYFYSRNSGLQNQSVVYVADSLAAQPRILIDPNTLSKDGTVALSGMTISEDGQYMAYGVSAAGSDWQEWKVRRIKAGEDLPDRLQWIKWSSAAWTHDARGFFYSRFPEPAKGEELRKANYDQKLYYHRLGDPQSQDQLIYQRPDQKEWQFGGSVTDDGRYLIIDISQGTERKNRVLYKDLRDPSTPAISPDQSPVVELLTAFDAEYRFIDNSGPIFLFQTDKDAPRNRIIAIDIRKPQPENWRTIVPENADTLESANVVGDRIIARYLHDAHSRVGIYSLEGKEMGDVKLPGLGSAGGFAGRRTDRETFYQFTSFTTPGTIYRYDLETATSTIFRQPKVAFNPDDYQTQQVFYASKDGTRIPMFITHKKGLKLDGKNPTYLYGYGGFQISITPAFSVSNLVWMEMGGIYAVANLRGGGEYGTAWHDAGRKLKKQNVFDDFISAGEWLIKNGYTSPEKLAIGGGSNGGLLVGACLTQRPDLFAAAVPAVGVMDMLRFNKFTIGWAWTSDYGSPESPEDFKVLRAYSPLHNIKPGAKYPATLITTGDHDDRVFPAHSFKFAAALQAAQIGPRPVLIRIETRAGHGAGKPTTKIIDEAADRWAFLARELGVDQPK